MNGIANLLRQVAMRQASAPQSSSGGVGGLLRRYMLHRQPMMGGNQPPAMSGPAQSQVAAPAMSTPSQPQYAAPPMSGPGQSQPIGRPAFGAPRARNPWERLP